MRVPGSNSIPRTDGPGSIEPAPAESSPKASAGLFGPATRDSALLCERCGYHMGWALEEVGGEAPSTAQPTTTEHRCPECGLGISESLPQRRTGSLWQREMGWTRRGLRAWALTSLATLFTPTKVFDRVAVTRRGAWPLLIINTLLASIIVLSPLAGVTVHDPLRNLRTMPGAQSLVYFAGWYTLFTAGLALLLGAMMTFEYYSVRFISARRQWRLLPDAALQAVAHASVGWIVAAVLGHLAWQLIFIALRFTDASALLTGSPMLRKIGFGQSEASLVFVAMAYFAGMFWFELIVFRGIRRMRFANAPREAAG